MELLKVCFITAKEEMKNKAKHLQDSRLSKREFRHFVTTVADLMPGADSFEYFVEFLNNSVEVCFTSNFLLSLISCGITLSQTTNFRLFKIGRVCRQFQV